MIQIREVFLVLCILAQPVYLSNYSSNSYEPSIFVLLSFRYKCLVGQNQLYSSQVIREFVKKFERKVLEKDWHIRMIQPIFTKPI